MKKRIFYMLAAAMCGSAALAQTAIEGVSVSNMKMERNGDYLAVEMLLKMQDLKVSSNRAVLLTPRLINGSDSLSLPSVGIYGRQRYYHYVRNGESMLSGKDEASYKASQMPDSLEYKQLLPYQEWMNDAELLLRRNDYGCCHKLLASQNDPLGRFTDQTVFFPELVYVRPQAELVKSRALEGSAFIDFPVDQTVIYPDYRNNTAELGKIQATIDSVRGDRDVNITQVWLKGFASPESPYAHNTELAIGRTKALKNYIQQLYSFDSDVIATDYEPEDWAGLRKYVVKSNINRKAEILAIIDSNREPDAKEKALKNEYPEEYRFLLQNSFPALRHTDYRIAYTIRSFSDVEEIERILRTEPQKLSLNELYLVAQKYEPGSEEFTEVFETAVRMFPDDATANLNAANAAMRSGDNEKAARYLAKAGDTPEAVYTRAALAIRNGDLTTARRLLREAQARGVEQAAKTLQELPAEK